MVKVGLLICDSCLVSLYYSTLSLAQDLGSAQKELSSWFKGDSQGSIQQTYKGNHYISFHLNMKIEAYVSLV